MTMDDERKQIETAASPRILYFGMLGILSALPLAALLAAEMKVCGVVVPSKTLSLPATGPITAVSPGIKGLELPLLAPSVASNTLHQAWPRHIPVYAVSRLANPQTEETLAALQPDIICVSCFPLRFPPSLLSLPPLGCLNLHPSLLPHFRGPDPLFWTFRTGQMETGVTVHFMDEGMDTGDLALQAPVTLSDGMSGREAEQLMAEQGGKLLVEAVQQLAAGTLPRRPQPEGGSYWPAPAPADFTMSVNWPARRAFNFMQGTAERGQPYMIMVAGKMLSLRSAVYYNAAMTLPNPILWRGGDVLIQMNPGVLRARLTH